MKKILLAGALLTAGSTYAAVTAVSGYDGLESLSPDYGSNFYTDVDVQVGDYIVISHVNNKRTNAGNLISISDDASNSYTTLAAGEDSSGSTTSAYLFYTEITTANSGIAISLDTASGTKTVSDATSLWVLRAGAGETIAVGGTDTNQSVASNDTSVGLNLDGTAGYAIAGIAFGSADTENDPTGPIGWSLILDGNNRRLTYANATHTGTEGLETWTVGGGAITGKTAAVGAIFTAVPEPSAYALLAGLSTLAMVAARRRRA